jgi:hypothetical protein
MSDIRNSFDDQGDHRFSTDTYIKDIYQNENQDVSNDIKAPIKKLNDIFENCLAAKIENSNLKVRNNSLHPS